jgi:hypothetical protein
MRRSGRMSWLEKISLIDEDRLDQKLYFQSLFQEICKAGLLSSVETERIQLELVELMGKEIERYTNDESSSVRVEKAQEILQSITYCIGNFLKTTTDMTQKIDILKTEKISDLFHMGMNTVNTSKSKAWKVLKDLQENCQKPDNYEYRDTIFTGLPEFFHNYNIEFGADQIPGDFDYPLNQMITELTGIEYIVEYLDRFTREDKFLRCFPVDSVNRVLKGYDKEAEHLLINIFEIVLINALGCILLGQKAQSLDIRQEDLKLLQNSLEMLTKEELENKLETALMGLYQELHADHEMVSYARTALPPLTARLKLNLQTGTLDKLFITKREDKTDEITYEDGTPMEDEKLRSLIKRMILCEYTSDKVSLMRNTVSSMADFKELIEECFYEEEYEEVFQTLNENERALLHKILRMEAGLEYGEFYEPDKLWKKEFLRLGNHMK